MAPRKTGPKSQQGRKKQSGFQLPHNLGADKSAPSVKEQGSAPKLPEASPSTLNTGTETILAATTRQLRPRVPKGKTLSDPVSTGAIGQAKKEPKTATPKSSKGQLGFKVTKPLSASHQKAEQANGVAVPIKEDGDHDVIASVKETVFGIDEANATLDNEPQQLQDFPQAAPDQPAEDGKKRPKKKIQQRTPYEKEMRGLAWHKTPFPELVQPTAEACEEVHRLLADQLKRKEDRVISQPETVPPPSLEVAGCGEVPNILDALIRTLLSASTTFDNSDSALRSLIKCFGTITVEGPHSNDDQRDIVIKDEIDFMKIHRADVKEVEKAIECGGLGPMKSKFIKGILDQVYSENLFRVEAFRQEKLDGVKPEIDGVDALDQGQKDMEIWLWEHDVLSLDYHCSLTPESAMNKFIKFPGIGVKTAACVILFCMRQPCFAVDTHVWRLCKWLNWAPAKADRNSAFAHLDVRVPDYLKYALHQLFIYHGKNCKKCKVSNFKVEEDWENEECPLEHLLQRTERKKATKRKLEDGEGAAGESPERKKRQRTKVKKEEPHVDAVGEEAMMEHRIDSTDAAEATLNPEAEDDLSDPPDLLDEEDGAVLMT